MCGEMEGRMMKMGPNNARRVVWAMGTLSFIFFECFDTASGY